MNKFLKALRNEFVTGKTVLDWAMLAVGLVLQIIAIIVGYAAGTPDPPALIISGIAGVISVVLCSQGKISFYIFGYIQLITYVLFFSIPNHLHGETVENGMYFVTMLYGVYVWLKRYGQNVETKSTEIWAKKLTDRGNVIAAAIFALGTFFYYLFLKSVPMFGALDSDPFMDSITSVPAYIAQVLMVLGYREQWVYWFILDVGSVVLAIRAGSWVMTAQFVFWTLNCVYGYWMWTKSNRAIHLRAKTDAD